VASPYSVRPASLVAPSVPLSLQLCAHLRCGTVEKKPVAVDLLKDNSATRSRHKNIPRSAEIKYPKSGDKISPDLPTALKNITKTEKYTSSCKHSCVQDNKNRSLCYVQDTKKRS
jgi:hypothetical protein